MATIQQLMPYLERGCTAYDPVRRAYLQPVKKGDGTLEFQWTAYEMEGEWSGPEMHAKASVETWDSDEWGIECGGGESEEEPDKIEQAIAQGRCSLWESTTNADLANLGNARWKRTHPQKKSQ